MHNLNAFQLFICCLNVFTTGEKPVPLKEPHLSPVAHVGFFLWLPSFITSLLKIKLSHWDPFLNEGLFFLKNPHASTVCETS